MPYNLMDETETHFVLHDGNESFPIAKYGLDDTTMGRIRSLPMGYADGGMVQPQPVAEYDPTGLYSAPQPDFQVVPSVATGPDFSTATSMGSGAPVGMPIQQSIMPETVSTLGLTVPEAAIAQPTPTAAQPAMPSYLDYMNQFMGGQKQQGYELPSEYAKGYETMIQASKQQADASAQAALEQQKIYEEQVREIQLNEIARQKQEQAVQGELDKLKNDVATQKIDPTRVWSNMSTGNKVMAAISVFLGGVAGGMQGTDNKALGIINRAIDQDIDAQKSELGKKQNLLAINLQKYRNIQDAAAATKAQLMAVTQAQVQATAAKAGSQQAMAAAQMFQGQTELEMGKLKMQLAASQMTQGKLLDPRGMSAQDAMKMNQDIQDKLVQLPNGNYYPAFNKESAAKVRDVQTEMYNALSTIKQAKNFMEQGSTYPFTERNSKAETITQSLLAQAKSPALLNLGALTNADLKLIDPLIPDVGSFFQEKNKAKLDNLEAMLTSKLNAYYSAYLPGLNPAGRQTREQSIFGRK